VPNHERWLDVAIVFLFAAIVVACILVMAGCSNDVQPVHEPIYIKEVVPAPADEAMWRRRGKAFAQGMIDEIRHQELKGEYISDLIQLIERNGR